MAALVKCGCFTKFNEMLKDSNTRLQSQLVIRDMRGGTAPTMVCLPVIGTERIATERGTKKAVGVIPTFCPFCGAKYPAPEDADAPPEPA